MGKTSLLILGMLLLFFFFCSDFSLVFILHLLDLENRGEINWDIGEIESSGGTPTIDWGEGVGEIEIVDDMEIGVDSFVVEESGSVSTTTILDNGETKRKLMSDLMELEIFLMQRLSEMKGKANLLSINQFQYASSLIQRQTISTVETFLECIQNILKQFNSDRIKLLFEMKSSRLFVERTSLTIRQKEDAASKLQMIVLELTSKRETYAGLNSIFFFDLLSFLSSSIHPSFFFLEKSVYFKSQTHLRSNYFKSEEITKKT